ncbi:hypothetical protein HOLleu_01195 [Holothuria leucospilota]|uniref:Uncharacterized protein n=1 Tax=Holothuria leucospilota TaxID=206669 RepID=A0A9Q1CQP3_HOLLE|nr:hypothetical protein HOLleu_01195 [Holothuria leucospilota]
MSFDLNKFLANPSMDELNSFKKSEMVKIAKHFGIEHQSSTRKNEIKRYIAKYLVDENIAPSTAFEAVIKVQTDSSFELKRLELEMQNEIKLTEIERERKREEKAIEHEFRMKQLGLQKDNVENIFTDFELLAEQLKWTKDKWSILIQGNFVDKAQDVYFSLSIEDSVTCDVV